MEMGLGTFWFGLTILIIAVVTLFLGFWAKQGARRKGAIHQPPRIMPQASTPRVEKQPTDPTVLAALRQNLRVKVLYNEAIIDRLIELERQRMPNAPLQSLMEAAIERWERENR
jgi:hypothetical protein